MLNDKLLMHRRIFRQKGHNHQIRLGSRAHERIFLIHRQDPFMQAPKRILFQNIDLNLNTFHAGAHAKREQQAERETALAIRAQSLARRAPPALGAMQGLTCRTVWALGDSLDCPIKAS